MIKLENLKSHIDSLSRNDWEKLFDLIPKIESTKQFVVGGGFKEVENNPDRFIITPVIEDKIVLDFEEIMY